MHRPNLVWAADSQFDQTRDRRPAKILNIVDVFTREALATRTERHINADAVVATLDKIAGESGHPAYVRFDHGPEFVAYAVADWCRSNGTWTIFINPGSPSQNGFCESFNSRLRTGPSLHRSHRRADEGSAKLTSPKTVDERPATWLDQSSRTLDGSPV